MLKTHKEIKAYVLDTIRSGDKRKIDLVIKRYREWTREKKTAFDNAKDIFK